MGASHLFAHQHRQVIMTKHKKYYQAIPFLATLFALSSIGCQRDIDELQPATFPTTAEVFIDGFSAGLNYSAFGGSKVTAFDVDEDEAYDGTAAMVFAVPNAGDPEGSYAGGAFTTSVGRDLSGFNALTFWARASKAATLDLIGFGNDLDDAKYQTSLQNLPLTSNWTKYYIPIPDPSKLTAEKGMLFYSEGPEDGLGYTFWLDEVKFEKLGSLARAEPGILQGESQVVSAETGDVLTIGDLYVETNLPTGVDQRAQAAPGYYTFSSSATSVATVNALGAVSVLDSGTAVITAMMAGTAATGSLTINSTGLPIAPPQPAPTPTVSSDSVISLFSNAYEDVLVDTWNTRWEFSTAEDADIQVDGDDIKRYKMLNFVGIEFSSQTIDASEMTHFHLDLWTPDPTDAPLAFKILLIDFGADGTFGGGDDTSHELAFTAPVLQTEAWVSIDVPLTSFAGLTSKGHLAQMVLSGDLPNVFLDNVYFYKGGATASTGPEQAAPSPTTDAAKVISVFSDVYDNIEGTDLNPDWGQATVASEEVVEGNNTLVYRGLNYQGIQLGSAQDVSTMTHLHLDFWTENSTLLNVFLISPGPTETAKSLSVPTDGWVSMDIPLEDFSPVMLAELIQLKFDGNGDIFLDNIYFYQASDGGGSSAPDQPAPTPTREQANVIAVFSDAYMNVEGTDFNPDWGQATLATEQAIEGNNTLSYSGLNYQGIQLGGMLDVSGMTHLHMDFWTSNSSALNVFLISPGPTEMAKALTVPTSGWASIDIDLTDFSPVNLAEIIQFKFDGNGDIFLDNIYFYREGDGGGMEPMQAAPTPIQEAANVISVFSDAYANLEGTDLNPDWGQATVVSDQAIEGNNTLLYSGLNYQGIQLASGQDLTGMDFLHVDVWTANAEMLEVFLISSGPVEMPKPIAVPTEGWLSMDIPLADFSPVDLSDVIQFKFVGSGDVYLDNLFFYSEGMVGGDAPTEAAPLPIHDAADVISVFSNAYENIAGTDLKPDWGQATVVTETEVAGDPILNYAGLNYQGIQLGSVQDVSGMTHLHVDYWTQNSTQLNVFLISEGPVEKAFALEVPTSGWNSMEIPLTDFSPVDLAKIIQFKFDGNGDIYLDNLYFHK